ncbi:MAG: IclR family transcriptional regulator [Burkholderiales bacterium]|nr:IclR family transcriptional regulator [Burkholderiales bacterium]
MTTHSTAGRKAVDQAPPAEPEAEAEDRKVDGSQIKSVSLTIRLLNEMAAAGEPIGVSELARRVGEAKARIHRHLLTLREAGILMQSAGSDRYQLGWKLFELGQAAIEQFNIMDIAAAPMRALRDATRLTVLLGQRAGDEVVVTHTFDSESMIAVTVRKGLRVPAHGSASGRVMLAFAPQDDRERILSRPLKPLTANTPTDSRAVREQLERIRRELYDCAASESQYGVNSLAAPVLDEMDRFIAVIAVVGTQMQVGVPPEPALVDQVRACAAQISAALNSRAYRRFGEPAGE